MPKRTATRRGLTRLTPILTTAVVRSRASRAALLSLLVLSASGCENNSSIAPTPLPPSPSVTVTTVRLEGRVLDEDNEPVVGATITVLYNLGGSVHSTTADATGSFSLSVDWPANWPGITLRVAGGGYESTTVPVAAAEAARAVLINMYRSLTISPGESIQATLSLTSVACGMAGNPCRRVMVNSPPGGFVDLEVAPMDGQEEVGLERTQLGWGVDLPRRLTVAGGDEVWIVVGEPGRVTLRAEGR